MNGSGKSLYEEEKNLYILNLNLAQRFLKIRDSAFLKFHVLHVKIGDEMFN